MWCLPRGGFWARTPAIRIGYDHDQSGVSVLVSARTRLASPSSSIRLGEEATDCPRATEPQVGAKRGRPYLDVDVAAEPKPGDAQDCGRRFALTRTFHANIRDEALLDAEPTVSVLVPLAETGDTGWCRE